jgi:hypothetical protein
MNNALIYYAKKEKKYLPFCQVFISMCDNIDYCPDGGKTAFGYAYDNSNFELMRRLIEAGAKNIFITSRDKDGEFLENRVVRWYELFEDSSDNLSNIDLFRLSAKNAGVDFTLFSEEGISEN